MNKRIIVLYNLLEELVLLCDNFYDCERVIGITNIIDDFEEEQKDVQLCDFNKETLQEIRALMELYKSYTTSECAWEEQFIIEIESILNPPHWNSE